MEQIDKAELVTELQTVLEKLKDGTLRNPVEVVTIMLLKTIRFLERQ